MTRRYPTHNGVAIPSCEIDLPRSSESEYNNHHLAWTAANFSRSAIFQTFRDLESNQEMLPIDTHTYIHQTYDPPAMPTVRQALERIESAKDQGENLKFRSWGGYALQQITDEMMNICLEEYKSNDIFYIKVSIKSIRAIRQKMRKTRRLQYEFQTIPIN